MVKGAAQMSGIILYRGPSMLDGAPIVCIATGIEGKASRNGKTGKMVQTWILREDIAPHKAIHTGADVSICGDCEHRGTLTADIHGMTRNVGRSCYVTVFQAPLVVWKAYHRGIYAEAQGGELAGLIVRLGAYGDPAAVPFYVWERALIGSSGHNGYTHQWRDYPELAAYCMASCDSEADRLQAKFLGFRTFRVRGETELKLPGEAVCPASAEAGHKTVCSACKACGGTTAKARVDMVIIANGSAAKVNAYQRRMAA